MEKTKASPVVCDRKRFKFWPVTFQSGTVSDENLDTKVWQMSIALPFSFDVVFSIVRDIKHGRP